jgi:hypothetical protein
MRVRESLARFALVSMVALAMAPAAGAQTPNTKNSAPETFKANGYVAGAAGAAASEITMQVDRYSTEADRDAVANALKHGGYPAFLTALRQAPPVGKVTVAGQTVDIRWAREQVLTNSRSIVLITDKPVFFVGGGATNAKPRAGYEVAVMEFTIDNSGLGVKGTMAAAARVKPGGATGVQIDDYGDKPIQLKGIRREIK